MLRKSVLFVLLSVALITSALAQPNAPVLNSRAGAAYTMYLNFTGFNYTGNWGGQTPGITPAYNGQTGPSFTAAEQANIKDIWSRVAETYSMYNINVTTVDPAAAAGHTTYLARQHFYDTTARVHHTVIGDGAGSFFGGAAGVSYVGVWDSSHAAGTGYGTNWTFTNRSGGSSSFKRISSVTAHENGHAAGLLHQGDYVGATRVNEYSTNDGSTHTRPVTGTGNSQIRTAWSVGRINTDISVIENDALRILQNNGMGGFINDGVGRTMATATSLSLAGNGAINSLANQGIIVPVSNTNPNPIGIANYTKGYFSFTTAIGGINTITVNAGTQWITPGVPDPHQSLDASLRILDQSGNELAAAITASFSETVSLHLNAGNYFIEVSSAGGKFASLGPNNNWEPRYFYDMGSYFLSGNIQSVPEPSSVLLIAIALFLLALRRNRLQLSCAA
jgi:PEP-CTERM motif